MTRAVGFVCWLRDEFPQILSREKMSESPPVLVSDPEPNQPKVGWQQTETRQTEHIFIHEEVLPGDDPHRVSLRSQHGPLASAPFTALPTSRVTRIDAQPFRLLMCRRLHLPLSSESAYLPVWPPH